MRIGIDGRNLTSLPSGISRYVVQMVDHLAVLSCDIRLYLPRPYHEMLVPPRVQPASIGMARSLAERALWSQVDLPRLSATDRVDIFWGPSHRLPPRLGRAKGVLTIHDLVWVKAPETMAVRTWLGERIFMDGSVRKADLIITDSEATRRDLTSRYGPRALPVSVIYPGVTPLCVPTQSKIMEALGITGSFILFVGTLEPRKNLARLLEAYSQLDQKMRTEVPLVIVGASGWKMPALSELVVKLDLESWVRITGYVSDSDLAFLYSRALFLAMPSLYEGFGLPILEANAVGAPVLTSRVSSMPEVAGNAAHLVDPLSTESIREGLALLIGNDSYRRVLSLNAKANSERFSWAEAANQLYRQFESLVANA